MKSNWYDSLNKSPLTPPDWVFGVVWPNLYLLLTISLYLIWSNPKCYPMCNPVVLFLIGIMINLTWTTVFFKYHKLFIAFIMNISMILTK